MSHVPASLNAQEDDIAKMIACGVHLGTRNIDPSLTPYIWKRRADGVHIIDLQKCWEKLVLAARIIVAIENPADVVVVCTRPYGQRAVMKFAKYTGATALAGRWTPGTLTNQSQQGFAEPRLVIVADPRSDHQPLKESSYGNVPTIAFANTDSPLNFVDVAIPGNNKGKQAVGLLWWLLAREVLLLRNKTPGLVRGTPWSEVVDLFFYREPEEQEKEGEQPAEAAANAEEGDWPEWEKPAAEWGGSATGDWGAPTEATGWDASVVATTSGWENSEQ